jgi:hypothetical protein
LVSSATLPGIKDHDIPEREKMPDPYPSFPCHLPWLAFGGEDTMRNTETENPMIVKN